MALSFFTLVSIWLALSTYARAGFNPSSSSNVIVYWGQNSYGQGSGNLAQQRLSYYCSDSNIDVLVLSFLVRINGVGGQPETNFANAGDRCTTFSGTNLLNCPEIAADIASCQGSGKTIILSIGGATYTEGGFTSSSAATAAADKIWAMFGPQQSGSGALRPFGSSSVNGFDFDFEAGVTNMVPFANRLRSLMDASGKYYLMAAPQCPYPDYAMNEMLNGAVSFDSVNIQFYNNYCGTQSFTSGSSTQNNFNMATWDNWAKTVSKNKAVKVTLGVPGGPSGAGSGYADVNRLREIIRYCKGFSSFGGVMMWDVSQAYANSGFLAGVKSALTSSFRVLRTRMNFV